MPYANEYNLHGRGARILLYGPDKSKKTWFACRAAEAGYNVILLDGDDGSSIVKQLPIEAQKRVLVADVVNTQTVAIFCRFMGSFMRPKNAFLWDEQEKKSVPSVTKLNPQHSYIRFEPSKFTMNDVVVIDSWTALAASTLIEWANEQGVDLTAIEKEGDQFSLLGFQSRFLDYCLNQIKTLPCHVIVIGHETVYEKFEGKGRDRKMVSSEIIPISSSGPQGKKLGKMFNDVLRFYKLSATAYRIDSQGDKAVAGGSRLLPPAIYDWEKVTPQTLFENLGSKATGEPCLGAQWIAPGSNIKELPVNQTGIIPAGKDATAPQVLNGGNTETKSKIQLLREKSLQNSKPQT